MTILDYLKATDILVGLIVTVFGLGSAGIVWLHRRINASVALVGSTLGAAQAVAAQRMDVLERNVTALSTNVHEARTDVGRIETRLSGVERTVQGLPSSKDIHDLIVTMTRMDGRMDRIEEGLRPIRAFSERMQEWMLEQGR